MAIMACVHSDVGCIKVFFLGEASVMKRSEVSGNSWVSCELLCALDKIA